MGKRVCKFLSLVVTREEMPQYAGFHPQTECRAVLSSDLEEGGKQEYKSLSKTERENS